MMNGWKMRSIYPPNKLFKKISPFPPIYRYRFFKSNNKFLLRDLPITLYERGENHRIRWLGFVYLFLYYNERKNLVLRLERLCSFLGKGIWSSRRSGKIYDLFLDEFVKVSRFVRAELLEAEVYRKIGGEIYFPSTLSFVNSYNSTDVIKPLKRAGLKERATKLVFTLPFKTLTEKGIGVSGLDIRRYNGSSKERKSYWYLWSKNLYRMEDFFPEKPWDWELDYGLIPARDPRFTLFAWKGNKVVGFVHWLPNFYRIYETPWKTKSSGWVMSQSREIEGGKIFKVAVDPKFDSKTVRVALCLRAVKAMREFGLTKTQIDNVYVSDKMMLDVVEELGGKKLHVIELLEKRVSTGPYL